MMINRIDCLKRSCQKPWINTRISKTSTVFLMILSVSLNERTLNFIKVTMKCLGLDQKLNLKYVRIYFGAETFNRVTKDRAIKFVDEISAIGGTMGLFTGFSIMSAVEIVYFGTKLILQIGKKILTKKTKVMTVK